MRFAVLPVVAFPIAVAALAVGCSSSSNGGHANDAGPDGTSSDSSTVDAAGVDGAVSDAGDAGALDDASDAGTVTITTSAGTPVSAFAYGQNYWDWVDWGNNGVTGLTGTEPLVQAQKLNVLRAGGDNNDWDSPQLFDTTQIDAFVAYCRAVGAEPILQVPIVANNVDGGAATADTAAAMVTYANVTKGYDIHYWEVGNEPDIYPTQFDAGVAPQDATSYCTVFHSYVQAMKAANAAGPDGGTPMQFLGPELAYEYTTANDWLTPFLDGCKDDVDIVSIHRYPFAGSGAQGVSAAKALADVTAFRSTVAAVNSIVAGHARPGTPLAITEANLSYAYATSSYTDASILSAPGTFTAALWTADVMGAALESNLWTLAFWNIGEQPGDSDLLGFIVGGTPGPQYQAEKLISANFKGDVVKPAGVPSGFSVYANHDATAAQTSVVVINKTQTTSRLGVAVDALPTQSLDFPAMSITLVQIPDADAGAAAAVHVTRYTGDDADAGADPEVLQ